MRQRSLSTVAAASWPATEAPPQVAGFVVSSFSPLAAAVADRCLAAAPTPLPERTAIVLASTSGDVVSAAHVARLVDSGARVGPLLFFQSVPNAVAGHIAARHGLCGPIVCLSPHGAALPEARAAAEVLIADGDADAALIIWIEQGPDHTQPDQTRSDQTQPDHAQAEFVVLTQQLVQGADR